MDTWDNHVASGYAGGNGSSSSPYKIQTASQLALLAKQSRSSSLTGYYTLEESLDISDHLWLGIGSSSTPFCGTFNGNYNYVYGMKIHCTTLKNIGFFNEIKNANISKAVLSGGFIYDTYDQNGIGFLVGKATGSGKIGNCIVENFNITCLNVDCMVGGLVGMAEGSGLTIEACIVRDSELNNDDGYEDEYSYVGGLIGESTNISIRNCAVLNVKFAFHSSTFTPNNIVITNLNNNSQIYSCYAKATYISRSPLSIISIKRVYGSSSDFGEWIFNSNLNRGYPVQKSFLTLAGSSSQTSVQVYNYLLGLGFSA